MIQEALLFYCTTCRKVYLERGECCGKAMAMGFFVPKKEYCECGDDSKPRWKESSGWYCTECHESIKPGFYERLSKSVVLIDGKYYEAMSDERAADFTWGK